MHVTERLRRMRLNAGLQQTELAKRAGYAGKSSIQRYEDAEKYPHEFLPLHFVRRIQPVLAAKGIPAEDVLALAGLPAEAAPAAVPGMLRADFVKVFVAAMAEYQEATALPLTPDEQAELIVTCTMWYQEEIAAGRKADAPLSVEDAGMFLRLLHRGRTA